MKKAISFVLGLALCLSLLPAAALAVPASRTAYASTQSVDVDGKAVIFQAYALKDANGYDTNYVKLRDVAHILNGTSCQFSVNWNGVINVVPGQPYTDNGSEMTTPFSGNRPYTVFTGETRINGTAVQLEAIELKDDNGGAYTYYKLQDLGAALGFKVYWRNGIFIETGSASQSAADAYADEVVRLVNEERAKEGLKPLATFQTLTDVAELRTAELLIAYSHTRPDGSSCFSAIDEAGVKYTAAGENIAYGFDTPASVVDAWMNSPGHRANILNSNFTHIGVGYNNSCWTQVFVKLNGAP